MTLEAGSNLGPYRIVEQVGRGGMATVYKAFQPSLKRFVAIKILPDFLAGDPGFRARFEQEAVAVAGLRHPNILTVFDHGEVDDVTFMVTEFVEGGTLADQLGKPLPVDYAVRILGPVAAALDYAHSRGVLHRDLKPSNVLIAHDGTPILSDFGLALMMTTSAVRLTQTGTILGTPEYMSPEHCEGGVMTGAADIYSLGVVAYEMLTGRVPFSAATPAAVLLAQIQNKLPPPRHINSRITPAVESALLKALAKSPADRFRTASDFVRALQALPAAMAPPAPRARPIVRVATFVSKRLIVLTMAVIVLTVLALGAWFLRGAYGPVAGRSSPSPPSTALHKGTLLFQAKLDGTSSDLAFITHSDASSSNITSRPGSIVFSILAAQGGESAAVNFDALGRYVTDLDFSVQPGSNVQFWWVLRNGSKTVGAHFVNIDTRSQTMRMAYFLYPTMTQAEALSPNVALPGLQSGQTISLSAVVDPPRYAIYLASAKVIDITDSRNAALDVPGFNISGPSGVGAVTVTAIRIYTIAD